MLYKKPKPSLMINTYTNFERRFKWLYHFETQGTGKSNPYDPDYDLHKESDMTPPMPPPFIENGLHSGQQFIEDFLTATIPSTKIKYSNSRLVWLTKLKSYLDEHDYV